VNDHPYSVPKNHTVNTDHLVLSCFACCALLPAQKQQPAAEEPAAARRFAEGGDLDKIDWMRPFARACEIAKEQQRVMLVKPILGGGNAPKPDGVACGGKNDCEGSW
jgi:hypothetical protein